MKQKVTTLAVTAVALVGGALAACIPGAAASSPRATYTQYCQNGTNTVYSQYSQYCQTTTTSTTKPTTTATTSPTTTTIVQPTTTTTVKTTTTTTTTTVNTSGPTVTISPLIQVGVKIDNNPNIVVTQVTGKALTINDYGTKVTLPFGAVIQVSPNGTLNATVQTPLQTVVTTVLPGVQKIVKIQAKFPRGVFIVAPSKVRSPLRVGSAATAPTTGSLTVSLKRPVHVFNLNVKRSSLRFSKQELRYIKAHHIKQLSFIYRVTSTTGKVYTYRVKVTV